MPPPSIGEPAESVGILLDGALEGVGDDGVAEAAVLPAAAGAGGAAGLEVGAFGAGLGAGFFAAGFGAGAFFDGAGLLLLAGVAGFTAFFGGWGGFDGFAAFAAFGCAFTGGFAAAFFP